MKIALVGYGKMGKIIHSIAIERGHEICHKINSFNPTESWENADVAIEFSKPESVLENIRRSIEYKVPMVVGTTGWNEQLENISKEISDKEAALFHASNFSLGVNIFYDINQRLARIMNDHPSYKIEMEEIHHTGKLDTPSGTAISIAEQIITEHDAYTTWTNKVHEKDAIPIHSLRERDVKGTHSVVYENDVDSIEVIHKAKNRKGFGLGAVLAAEFLIGKQGVFTMQDLLKK